VINIKLSSFSDIAVLNSLFNIRVDAANTWEPAIANVKLFISDHVILNSLFNIKVGANRK